MKKNLKLFYKCDTVIFTDVIFTLKVPGIKNVIFTLLILYFKFNVLKLKKV